MSLYPSLEDMKVDQMGRAQVQMMGEIAQQQQQQQQQPQQQLPYPLQPAKAPPPPPHLEHLYPALDDYMGLEFTQEILAANMPEYLPPPPPTTGPHHGAPPYPIPTQGAVLPIGVTSVVPTGGIGSTGMMLAPLSGQTQAIQRSHVTNAIREVTVCKASDGKVGMRVKAINKGIFVCLVKKESPAAMAGVRFGDQVLQVCGVTVAGYSMDKVHDILRKAPNNGIVIAVRDRPFERAVTLHKDSTGHIGFQFKDGEVTAIVKDSSAARNGLLIEHYLLEVNGQNVVGVRDKDISNIINECGPTVSVTIMPVFVYKHIMKHMAANLIKKMDHSIPDL
ncbi:hypothetical protein Pmani_009886 [Petrolisthes manimaculis]|uniref:PDZ domain-containing protein n=2 Tax=Petrolisthes manimaculis TaxID=1843537 RepID=A0AAE1Q636_9EUCA|nr:hypothetical protein Pmani_009886 [Petrolisthes manimaculis]